MILKDLKENLTYYNRFLRSGGLPNFLILGAQKAGTTSLFNYIETYGKNFLPPERKELYFFTEHFDKGLKYYRSFFPKCKKGQITGEATPDYLFYHKCPKRIKEALGNVKFIILLRNPIDRLISHYNFMNFTNKTNAIDPEPIDVAVRHEKDWVNLKDDFPINFNYSYKYYSYKSRGIYHKQLERWFDHFPRESFLIFDFDDFINDTHKVMNDVFTFLNIDAEEIPNRKENFPAYNKNINKGKNKLDPDTRKYLEDFFKPHNEALYKLINKNFKWL